MRLLIMTDIHANAPALLAVLKEAQSRGAQGYISLGDQINFGPSPRETMALLHDWNVRLLLGNHEERILRMRAGEQALFTDYNWSMLRWTAGQVGEFDMDYPAQWRQENMLLTHAVPGSLNTLVTPKDKGVMEDILVGLDAQWLVCGHNHTPWQYRLGDKQFVNPGSLGMLEDGRGSRAAYAMWEDGQVQVYETAYDPSGLKRAFVESGLADAAPEMARVTLETMLWGQPWCWIEHIQDTAREAGISWQGREAFRLAAESYAWAEDMSCQRFWMMP